MKSLIKKLIHLAAAGIFIASLTTPAFSQETKLTSKVYTWDELPVETGKNGERRQIAEGSTDHLKYLELHTTSVGAGLAFHAPHSHDDEELVIIKEGQVKVTVGDQSKVMGPGSIALIQAGEQHGMTNAGTTPATYYIMRYHDKEPHDAARGKANGGSLLISYNDTEAKPTGKGTRRDYFDRPTSATENFEMHVTSLNKGEDSHAPHTHFVEEIIVIMKGNTQMHIDGQLVDAPQGSLVYLGSNVPHALKNLTDGSCEYFAFQWK
ncbi:MAG: cupin domain-containing protein [Imperialibacter sp.]|uniref:cupin domain-containing protein n=1 Tax=Imperialibacter sp. TaxID=2038411 RepID=UPI003A866F2B